MSLETKIVRREPAAVSRLDSALHPLLRRIFAHRGIQSDRELSLTLDELLPPDTLTGVEQAIALLQQALADGARILVVADFDADGATSCAVALRALRAMGASQVDYLVPNRFTDGYGLTEQIVDQALDRQPDLLITVDNGIASIEGVARAREYGIKVLITDHHLPGAELPAAEAIVNPNVPGNPFPSKHLAGVGVIFYVMLALRARLRTAGWFEQQGLREPNLAALLDLVALGTVADVVPLDHNNRVLVQQGLARMRAGRCCAGISALLRVAGREQAWLKASDLGFSVAPRLNAAGRLEDMSLGIECLLAESDQVATGLARELDDLNRQRRQIEGEMRDQAMELMDSLVLDEALPHGLVLYDADWHQGVIGILAARIKERYHRPVVAFARGEGGELKGSCRSIGPLHIRDTLALVATRHPGLLEKFGGHAMAAGLTLAGDNLNLFRQAFDQAVAEQLSSQDLEAVVLSDGPLSPQEISLETALLLEQAGPWGQGYPEPLFDGEFEVLQYRVVGEQHLKLSLGFDDRVVDGIAFGLAEMTNRLNGRGDRVQITYRLDVNRFRGNNSLQLVINNMWKI